MTENPQPYKTDKDDFHEAKPFMTSFNPAIPFNPDDAEIAIYADLYLYALGEYLASNLDEHYLNQAIAGLNRGIWDAIRAGKQPQSNPTTTTNEDF